MPRQDDSRDQADTSGSVRWIVGLLGAVVAYLAAYAGWLPAPRYLPVQGAFSMSPPPGTISMGYYGLLLWGAAGYLVGFAVGCVPAVSGAFGRPATSRWLGRTALTAVLVMMAYTFMHEMARWG